MSPGNSRPDSFTRDNRLISGGESESRHYLRSYPDHGCAEMSGIIMGSPFRSTLLHWGFHGERTPAPAPPCPGTLCMRIKSPPPGHIPLNNTPLGLGFKEHPRSPLFASIFHWSHFPLAWGHMEDQAPAWRLQGRPCPGNPHFKPPIPSLFMKTARKVCDLVETTLHLHVIGFENVPGETSCKCSYRGEKKKLWRQLEYRREGAMVLTSGTAGGGPACANGGFPQRAPLVSDPREKGPNNVYIDVRGRTARQPSPERGLPQLGGRYRGDGTVPHLSRLATVPNLAAFATPSTKTDPTLRGCSPLVEIRAGPDEWVTAPGARFTPFPPGFFGTYGPARAHRGTPPETSRRVFSRGAAPLSGANPFQARPAPLVYHPGPVHTQAIRAARSDSSLLLRVCGRSPLAAIPRCRDASTGLCSVLAYCGPIAVLVRHPSFQA
ncbi:unnamed protein product [Pleuronectes platessa]|uniref:Uncharacterized protein n=1 Tax=Pleuronectes platessa TaxID=8262 RepID=A0A9N7ZD41_PLEPL|nr:unnamed protein product [Pleuronectes platessa]